MCDQGVEVKFRKHDCTVTNLSGDIVLSGKRDSGLYYYESSDDGKMLKAAGDSIWLNRLIGNWNTYSIVS
jgi:hypothetical protein